MDPLSVTASIVGILTAAAKIVELLHGTISSAKDAPHVLIALACEVQEVQAALSSLQILLADLSSAPPHRAALIQLDQLIVTLTASVYTFSELETAIAPFTAPQGAKVPLRARLKWTRAESNCTKIVERLQRHKASLSLMLNILQCASDADAGRAQSSLELMVEQLLQNNQQLCKRLKNLEDTFDARSTITKKFDNISFISQADDATITTARQSASKKRVSIFEAVRVRFAFEDDLQSSRVYRMAKNDGCNHSLVSSAIHTQSWSIFSGLSLADISVISVVALPLYAEDIQNHAKYYSFGEMHPPTSSETTATWTNEQILVDDVRPRSPRPLSVLSIEDPNLSSRDETITTSSDPSSGYQSHGDDSSSATSVSADAPHVDLNTLRLLESDTANTSVDLEDAEDSQTHLSAWDDLDSDMDEDDVVYPCKGCGEILEEGKAFELAGNRWHIECFRCNTCGTLLDSDANLLLLGDGSLICNNCTYACAHCGNKIEDLAILTGDQAFCAKCFRCRNCKRKIDNLRYARTSQGIFCMACHESLMARRRKKQRTTQGEETKSADDTYSDKLLPPLPPSLLRQLAPPLPPPSLPNTIDWRAPMFEDEGLSMLDDATLEALETSSLANPRPSSAE